MIYHFYQKEQILKNRKFVANLHNENMLFTYKI